MNIDGFVAIDIQTHAKCWALRGKVQLANVC